MSAGHDHGPAPHADGRALLILAGLAAGIAAAHAWTKFQASRVINEACGIVKQSARAD